jgi:hypothetical protein
MPVSIRSASASIAAWAAGPLAIRISASPWRRPSAMIALGLRRRHGVASGVAAGTIRTSAS